jgi:hypothetical protein
MTRKLVEVGAIIRKNSSGIDPLKIAAFYGHYEVIKELGDSIKDKG